MAWPDVATTLNYLGLLHRDTKSLSEPEAALRESLDIRRKLVDANAFAYQPEVAATLNSLGLLYQDAERLSEAAGRRQGSLRPTTETMTNDYEFRVIGIDEAVCCMEVTEYFLHYGTWCILVAATCKVLKDITYK